MTGTCPHCGFNLTRDEILELDGFRIDPRGLAEYRGKRLTALTAGMVSILHSLAKENGRPLTAQTLGERFSNGADPANTARVHITRMKWALKVYEVPVPIEHLLSSIPGMGGFYWHLRPQDDGESA